MTATTSFRPFNLRPVVSVGHLRATHRTAYASYCYIRREPDADQFGQMPKEWASRTDLIATGREHPAQTPSWARSGPKIWIDADRSIKPQQLSEAAASHIVLSLPPELEECDWVHIIKTCCNDHFASQGMISDWAIHYEPKKLAPHAHLLVTARGWRRDRSPGRRHRRWLMTQEAIHAAERAWFDISGLRPSVGSVLLA
jgi:hypothetical protein